MVEIKVPALPESVADATVAKWYKKPGDVIKRDENLVDLETDKVMLEVPATTDGVLEQILLVEGSVVTANQVLGMVKSGSVAAKPDVASQDKPQATPQATPTPPTMAAALSPATRRLVAEHEVDVATIKGTGKNERITKTDVVQHLKSQELATPEVAMVTSGRIEQRVPMTRLRARIAERLLAAQQQTAMLTTFNEVNMQPITDLRNRYKDAFEKKHQVRLGLMSFFVKAVVEALKRFPTVNAAIDGQDIIYHGYFDIGIAVASDRGLVVPVLRDVDNMTMAEVEKAILAYALKARDGKLTLEEMTGGNFTITNGGVFGSMLSTPIINLPQSAILGMHNIVKRAVVEDDTIVIRPMMYLALSYDHRLIDGRESVSFLVTIKQLLEDPTRLLLDI